MGPFATATELYEHIGEILPSDLARPQAFLNEASSLIRNTAGQMLSAVANETVILEASVTDTLYLPEGPVTAVSSVTENGTVLASGLYKITGWNSLRRLSSTSTSTLFSGQSWVYGATVVYSHGYLESDAGFGELRTLAIEVAARALQGPGGQPEMFGQVMPTTVGFSPSVFLTENEVSRLMSLVPVPVG